MTCLHIDIDDDFLAYKIIESDLNLLKQFYRVYMFTCMVVVTYVVLNILKTM